MAKFSIEESSLTAIADKIRAHTGSTEALTLDQMVTEIAGLSSGGGGEDLLAQRLNGTLTEYVSDEVTQVSAYAFFGNNALTSVELPNAVSVGDHAFYLCNALTSFALPSLTEIHDYAFYGTAITEITEDSLPNAQEIFNALVTEDIDSGGMVCAYYAFGACKKLVTVDLPLLTECGAYYTFSLCEALTTVNLPVLETIGVYSFNRCSALASVDLPALTKLSNGLFSYCRSLKTATFPAATNIGMQVFSNCSALEALVLEYDGVAILDSINTFNNSAIANGTGYIYVPDARVDEYKAATNWATYADQIKPLSEYTG